MRKRVFNLIFTLIFSFILPVNPGHANITSTLNMASTLPQIGIPDCSQSVPPLVAEEFDLLDQANALSDQERYEEAIPLYDEAIALQPDSAKAYFSRGVTYFDLGDYNRAAADYQTAARLNPADKCTHNNLGLTYEAMGNYDAALLHYNKALEIEPSFKKARINRSLLHYQRGEYGKGLADQIRSKFAK